MSNAPQRPERPRPPAPPEKPRSSNLLTLGLAFMMAIGGIVSLMVMPLVGYAPVIVLAVFCFIALHYFTWGWWLSKKLGQEREESAPDQNDRG
jgi:hypothetical protein